MGLFHVTCNVSNLPIRKDDICYLVLLVKSPDVGEGDAGHTAGHALWSPWSLPIQGVYDGYGRLTPYTTWHSRYVLERLQSVVLEVDDDRIDSPIDRSVRKSNLKKDQHLKHLQDLIRDSRVRVWADVDRELAMPLGMTFIREDVYRELVDAPVFTEDSIKTAKDAIASETRQMSQNEKNSFYAGDLDASMESLKGTELYEMVQDTLGNLDRYRRLAGSVGSYGPVGFQGIGTYRLHAAEKVMSGTAKGDPELLDEVQQLGSFIHFLLHFEDLRKLWQPQNGLGSTRCGWGSHVALSALVNRISHAEFEAETEQYQDPQPPTKH